MNTFRPGTGSNQIFKNITLLLVQSDKKYKLNLMIL